ncbi:PEP-CTERM sorting domain-containing protein [Nitrosomonas europaea]|uniref:PEP-CTERM sorting domain-containing protein n=1 Tax=Nitrosomonas europaea TaxID=915 RepID=UPI0007981BDB|nr:PEP-CTERM sorting domain-containing protein [Nitrosomonas europaea]KXK50783.1 MAG: PEP-CTERM motif protein [Nitrosomonas europaea]
MDFKSGIKHGVAITGIILGLSITPAQAGVAGSMVLDITGGCFSYGANGTTGCGISDGSPDAAGAKEYATGSFTFNNTLSGISNPAAYAYQASVSLYAEAPPDNPVISFDDTRSKSFATLADLQSDPLWNTAYAFVTAVLAADTNGSFTATIPTPPAPPGTTVEASWNYTLSNLTPGPGSTPAYATGEFKAWSTDDLNGLSLVLLGQKPLPASPVNFSLNVALSAIPEPATIALIGLGILGMGAAQRRKTPAALPV